MSDAEDLRLAESDSGIDLSAGIVCQACGARNNGGQTACWQCRAPLAKTLSPNLHTSPSSSRSRSTFRPTSRIQDRALLLSTLLVALIALGLSIWVLQQSMGPILPARTLGQLFSGELVTTRIALGVLLIAGWPLVLKVTVLTLGIQFKKPGHLLGVIGVLLGSATYALSFIPAPAGPASAIFLPLLLSLALFNRILKIRLGATAALCLVQYIAMTSILAISVWGLESLATRRLLNPARELPVIMVFASQPPNVARQVLPLPQSNAFSPFRWRTSGSEWLDHRANQMVVEVSNSDRDGTWNILLRAEGSKLPVDSVVQGNSPWRSLRRNPEPGVNYQISIESNIVPGDVVQIFSLLPFETP